MPCSRSSSPGPTPGELQQLRRQQRAAGQQHLGARPDAAERAVLHEFETDRALAVEQHALREGADFDLQVRPLHRRAQIGERGAAPPHLAHGQLVVADAFLLGAVEIGVGLEPGLLRGGDKGVVQFVAGAQIGDVERPAGAVIIVPAALLVLGAAEIRQHVVIAPADAAELPPIVEILPLPADIDQPVDRAGPAQHFSARPRDAPAVEPRHRLGLELPGDLGMVDVAVEPGRDVDPRVRVLAAGLDDEHLRARIGRSRFASTHPADPAPTMTKSYSASKFITCAWPPDRYHGPNILLDPQGCRAANSAPRATARLGLPAQVGVNRNQISGSV